MEVVADVASGEEAVEMARHLQPDIMLADIRLKGRMNGVELARSIRRESPDTRIVVLTNYANEPYIREMISIGVQGYMLKDTPPRGVIESIRMVMDGRTVYSSPVSHTLVSGYLNPSSVGNGTANHITERETEVVRLLADGATNTEIAERLHISQGTVQFHLTNIYGKLGVKGRAQAVVKAARDGLVVIDE
jgi:DNA-binding NarL/FixJ family response regulator